MKKQQNYKIQYSEFRRDKITEKYFIYLSNLTKLNILLEKNLITKVEYEKVKCAIEINA